MKRVLQVFLIGFFILYLWVSEGRPVKRVLQDDEPPQETQVELVVSEGRPVKRVLQVF